MASKKLKRTSKQNKKSKKLYSELDHINFIQTDYVRPQRITQNVGIFNHGKISQRISRAEIVRSQETEARACEDLHKILNQRYDTKRNYGSETENNFQNTKNHTGPETSYDCVEAPNSQISPISNESIFSVLNLQKTAASTRSLNKDLIDTVNVINSTLQKAVSDMDTSRKADLRRDLKVLHEKSFNAKVASKPNRRRTSHEANLQNELEILLENVDTSKPNQIEQPKRNVDILSNAEAENSFKLDICPELRHKTRVDTNKIFASFADIEDITDSKDLPPNFSPDVRLCYEQPPNKELSSSGSRPEFLAEFSPLKLPMSSPSPQLFYPRKMF